MVTKKTTTKKAATRKTAKRAPATKSTRGEKITGKKTPATKPAADVRKKLSALDAAAKVLATAKEPMTTRQMIELMAAKKMWTSPGGKTPHATLYAAILREIQKKGKDARFKKTERGKFAANW